MAKNSRAIRVGDWVRVKLSGGGLGDTRYEVMALGIGSNHFMATIRAMGDTVWQVYDTTGLVIDNSGVPLLSEILGPIGGR